MHPAMDLIRLLLPLAWTIAAVVVAIVLHRTTKAKLQTKWLLAGGSLIVFGAAFWLMKLATPTLLLRGTDETALRQAQQFLSEGRKNVETAIQSCNDSTRNELQCVSDLNALRATLEEAKDEMDAVLHPLD